MEKKKKKKRKGGKRWIEGKGSRFWERNAREDWEGSRGGIRWRGEAGTLLRVYMRAKKSYVTVHRDKSDIRLDRIDKRERERELSGQRDKIVSYPSNICERVCEQVDIEEDSARIETKRIVHFFFFFRAKKLFGIFLEEKRMGLFITLLVLCALNVILMPNTIYARPPSLLR